MIKLNQSYKCLGLVLMFVLAGCSSAPVREVQLMPAPDVYESGSLTPFTSGADMQAAPYWGILYATDRQPVGSKQKSSKDDQFYTSERGRLLRLGLAKIKVGKSDFTWEEARKISLAKNPPDQYPLKVANVDEFGTFHESYHQFIEIDSYPASTEVPAQRFVELINRKLKDSQKKNIFIYVPGYKVVFENPLLVATELWHYLGYEGVFIAYSWPATPKRTAYFSDSESTQTSVYHFRRLLEYLAQHTSAEHIDIIGYSQGTRLVTSVLHDFALMNYRESRKNIQRSLRIGNVILIGSDIDRGVMAAYIVDGLLKVPEHLTLYVSEKDKALGMSRFFFARPRVGQMFTQGEMSPSVSKWMRGTSQLSVINVTGAEGAVSENGHGYFRESPWVSSDILITLRYDLLPAERGLIRSEDNPVWHFPADYIPRLRNAILSATPTLNEVISTPLQRP